MAIMALNGEGLEDKLCMCLANIKKPSRFRKRALYFDAEK